MSSNVGRPAKYFFLIKRLDDDVLYSAFTIARLLQKEDLRRNGITGPFKEAKRKARSALARVAKSQDKYQPSGLVYTREERKGNAYPGYTGKTWKSIFRYHERAKQERYVDE